MIRSEHLFYEYTLPEESPKLQQPIKALNGVDIRIANGEFVAVLGHNGSGKSTLARHLNALLVPTKGTLWVKGWDTKSPEHLWDIRQTAGMVFQNPDNQLVATLVEEDVAFGPENLGVPPTQIRQQVDKALKAVDMSAYAAFAPHHLSGGQKQRVAIAGVLAMRPDCIVLDEPTAMLDPVGRKEVLDTVWRLNQEEGITVLLITHFMEEAVMASRVLVMDKGRVVMDDKPSHIFKQVGVMKALGLDVPPVTALAHELRKRGLPISEETLTPEDFLNDEFIQRLAGL